MSSKKRKIGYWSIQFVNNEDHYYFDQELFCNFMTYLDSLKSQNRLIRHEKESKAISIDTICQETKNQIKIYKIVFKSCKYNHSPDYMSSEDGSERPTDKKLFEGDKEITHMCIEVRQEEAYTIFEERRNGVTIRQVTDYLNKYFRDYFHEKEGNKEYALSASIIPSEDFLLMLKDSKRITVAELFVEKQVIGSDYLNLMELDDNSQEDIVMSIKANRSQSLVKEQIQKAFKKIGSSGSIIKRVRIRGKNDKNMDIILDSLNGKKIEQITVDLLSNGTVDTTAIFKKMDELIGIVE